MQVTDLAGPRVVRIDQRSGTSKSFNFGKDPSDTAAASDVAVGSDSVWLTRPDIGEIVRMDRLTGDVRTRLAVNAYGLAYGTDALWYWRDGSIGMIDPNTNEETFDAVPLSDEVGLGNIYFAGGDAWTSRADTGDVYRVDPSGRPSTYRLEPGVGEMAPTSTTMWITNANTGVLTGIDLITGQQDSTIETGHATVAAAAGGDQIMVAVGPTVDEAIAALPGSVLTLATEGFPWWDPAPDPPMNGDIQVRQALYVTCANLLTYPDKPGDPGLGLVPEVAAGMPTMSADGLTYTFTIRPGFQFSPPSNEQVTADTFRYSLQRAVSPVFDDGQFGPRLFGDIAGVKEYRDGTADHVTGLVANGDQFSITLVAPAPDILSRLASSFACPVPVNGTPPLRSGLKPDPPVSGAGPYYLAQTIRKRLVVFKQNPNYDGSRPRPFDEIAIRLQVAPVTALGMIHSGQIDAALLNYGDPLSGADSALATEWGPGGPHAISGDQRWFGASGTGVDYVALNPNRPAFSDPDIRQAVSLAIDRSAIASIWVTQPTGTLLVPSVEGTQPTPDATSPNIEAALALMKGRTVDVTMLGYPAAWGCRPCQNFEVALTGQLQKIGVHVTVRHPAGEDYPGEGIFDPGSDVDMLALGTGADYSDPVAVLGGLQDDPWVGAAILNELTRLAGVGGQPRIDGIVELARQLVDEQFLVVPTTFSVYPLYVSERIGCAFVQPAIGAVDLLSLCVKPSYESPAASASPTP